MFVTQKEFIKATKFSRRRPNPPREVQFIAEGNRLTWTLPRDTSNATHTRIWIDGDGGDPTYQVPIGQTEISLQHGSQAFIATWNETTQMKSPPVVVKVAPTTGGPPPPVDVGGGLKKEPDGTIVIALGDNMLVNPGFEDGLTGWTYHSFAVETSNPHGGAKCVKTDGTSAYLRQTLPCTPGLTYKIGAYLRSTTDANFWAAVSLNFLDANGNSLQATWTSQPNALAWTGASHTAVAPAGAVHVIAQIDAAITVGTWWVDDARFSTADGGIVVDADGNLVLKTGSSVGLDADGSVIVPAGAIQTSHLADGALGDLSKYSSTVRAIGIVFGLPTLPNANYPAGSIVMSLNDGKIYRTPDGNAWTQKSDPADLVAGTIAAGVVYAGTINANQINAGSLAAGVILTSKIGAAQINTGTIDVGSGGMTFSGSGGIILANGGNITASPGYVQAGTLKALAAGAGILIGSTTGPIPFGITATGTYASYAYCDLPLYKCGGASGWSGTFATGDGRTVTVSGGIITNVA